MNAVECRLCPRHCLIPEGGRGFCQVRTNAGGKLYSLVYGKPCAVHVDPVEKKPLYHFLPGTRTFSLATAGCNLRCRYCQNWQISQRPPEETRNIDLPPGSVVSEAITQGCQTISYTYSEPIVFFEYTYDSSRLARDRGLRNILVTAGYIEQEPLRELCTVIDAANVDLKGITEEYYRTMSQGTLRPVQEAIVTMKKMGVWVEITNLLVPTANDSVEDIRSLVRWVKANCGVDTPLHFSRFWPTHKLLNLPPTPEETLRKAWDIAREEGLRFVYIGNMPGHPGNSTSCPSCGKMLIHRRGYQILAQNIKGGKCPYCTASIAGVWQ